jgi:hypothetical protein
MLYDRIEKKSIAVNITYVEILKKQDDIQSIEMKIRKRNAETFKEGKQNAMN